MFAVIKTGGKQYLVSAGDQFTVEKLVAEAGETVQFDQVLMLGGAETKLGNPLKTGEARVVDMHEDLRPILLDWRKEWERIFKAWRRPSPPRAPGRR